MCRCEPGGLGPAGTLPLLDLPEPAWWWCDRTSDRKQLISIAFMFWYNDCWLRFRSAPKQKQNRWSVLGDEAE